MIIGIYSYLLFYVRAVNTDTILKEKENFFFYIFTIIIKITSIKINTTILKYRFELKFLSIINIYATSADRKKYLYLMNDTLTISFEK